MSRILKTQPPPPPPPPTTQTPHRKHPPPRPHHPTTPKPHNNHQTQNKPHNTLERSALFGGLPPCFSRLRFAFFSAPSACDISSQRSLPLLFPADDPRFVLRNYDLPPYLFGGYCFSTLFLDLAELGPVLHLRGYLWYGPFFDAVLLDPPPQKPPL